MGWASYEEDIISRFGAAFARHRPSGRRGAASTAGPAANNRQMGVERARDGGTKMSPLKEFTVSAARPLPVILLADVSGSMATEGKIQALNHAVREMIATFQDESDLRAEIHVAVITFGGQARINLALGPARKATWTDLDASGGTPMGAAFDLVREMIEDRNVVPSRAYRPTIALVSDGQPTPPGSETEPLRRLLESERGGKAFRMALAIGSDADHGVLQAFLAESDARVFRADEARQIRDFFQLVTMSVSARSRSANPNSRPASPASDGWDL